MCGAEREDLKHFMLWSPAYTQEGMKSERLQQLYPDDVTGKYLIANKYIKKQKEHNTFWRIREKEMKEKEEN